MNQKTKGFESKYVSNIQKAFRVVQKLPDKGFKHRIKLNYVI